MLSMLAPSLVVKDAQSAQTAVALSIIICTIALAALKHFRDRNLHLFDALVGETSCQLRTKKIVNLAEALESSAEAQAKLNSQIDRIQAIRARLLSVTVHLIETPLKACEFIDRLLRDSSPPVNLSEDDQFLVLAHLLYLTRDKDDSTNTNESNLYALLERRMAVEKIELERFVWKAKEVLSLRSIEFLRQEVNALVMDIDEKEVLKLMASNKNILVATKLPCSPCFYNIQTLLENMRHEHRPIVLKIHRANVRPLKILLCSQDGRSFQICNPLSMSAHKAAMVFEGTCRSNISQEDLLERLLGKEDAIPRFPGSRVMEVLLANAAAHPQYAGKNKHNAIPSFIKKKDDVELSSFLNDIMLLYAENKEQTLSEMILKLLGPVRKAQQAMQNLCTPVPLIDIVKSYIRLQLMKKLALDQGLCEANPSLFQLEHIIASTVGKEFAPEADITANNLQGASK